MRSSTLLSTFLSLRFALAQDDNSNAGTSLTSPKRGLIYVKTENSKDNHFWTNASDLTWYYNYESTPTSAIDHSQLQFVPMLWGASNNDNFASTVKGLVSSGMNITYVLGFNEPDGCSNGGSCVDTQTAVRMWKDQMEPLGKMGIKLGGPAVTNAETGFEWLQSFFTLCNGECTVDFLPAHYYGNFEGLASHLGRVNATYKVRKSRDQLISSEHSLTMGVEHLLHLGHRIWLPKPKPRSDSRLLQPIRLLPQPRPLDRSLLVLWLFSLRRLQHRPQLRDADAEGRVDGYRCVVLGRGRNWQYSQGRCEKSCCWRWMGAGCTGGRRDVLWMMEIKIWTFMEAWSWGYWDYMCEKFDR